MVSPFDVFKQDELGVLWIGKADSLDDAHQLIRVKANGTAGEYLIVSLATGNKKTVVVDGATE